ncbi:MAG: ferredoxin--NADP reductase [Legionellaceae bacterium]|nr:ferredoxin--NADP reductase [Legionellaceae bacterium]
MAIKTFPVILEQSLMISPKVKHFIFRADGEPAFAYKPGQFITIHFEYDGKMLRRSYSIANPPSGDNRIEFAAGYVEGGPGTELLFNLEAGDSIQINGPFGRLILKEEQPRRYILVATSTGVTPYRAMLPELARRLQADSDLRVEILLGVQHAEEVLYAEEFQHFAAKWRNANFTACLSRASATDLSTYERCGYVQHHFEALHLNPEHDTVYLCGNPAMIDEAFALLQAKGFSMPQIIREKYISN